MVKTAQIINSVFARRGQKKHCWFLLPMAKHIVNNVVCGFRGANNIGISGVFLLRGSQKYAKTTPIWRCLGVHKNAKISCGNSNSNNNTNNNNKKKNKKKNKTKDKKNHNKNKNKNNNNNNNNNNNTNKNKNKVQTNTGTSSSLYISCFYLQGTNKHWDPRRCYLGGPNNNDTYLSVPSRWTPFCAVSGLDPPKRGPSQPNLRLRPFHVAGPLFVPSAAWILQKGIPRNLTSDFDLFLLLDPFLCRQPPGSSKKGSPAT